MESRDRQRLAHIVEYCDKITASCSRYGNSLEALSNDVDYQQSVAFSLVQIGELVAGLSEELKAEYDSIPWRGIKSMRNIVVHGYGSISLPVVWDTINSDVPELREVCLAFLEADE